MRCLSSAKLNMRATVLKASGSPEGNETGRWQVIQNVDSGAIEKFWVVGKVDVSGYADALENVPVLARGVLNAGLVGAGDTEKFGDIYQNIDWVKMQFPAWADITVRDRVTSIRDQKGNVIWRDTTIQDSPPMEFDVMGITPIVNPFGQANEYTALLKRAEVQNVR